MTQLTQEQIDTESLLKLASKVTGLATKVVRDRICTLSSEGDWEWFLPKLDGEDWQKAQALDVIVAALSLPGALALHKFETTKGTYFQFIRNRDPGLTWEDPLQAACAALLQEGR